jgi:hypothetical protein
MTQLEYDKLSIGDIIYDDFDLWIVTDSALKAAIQVDSGFSDSRFIGTELRLPKSLMLMASWHVGFLETAPYQIELVPGSYEEAEPTCKCQGPDISSHSSDCSWKKWNDKRRATWGLQK